MSTGVWTDNWQAIKNTLLLGNVRPGMNTLVDLSGTTRSASNQETRLYVTSPFGMYSTSDGYGTGVLFGSGTAAPAAADYTLADRIPSGRLSQIAAVNAPLVCDPALGTAEKTVYVTVQCRYASGITIREWGIWAYCDMTTNNYGDSGRYLVYRGLLDTPLTLQENETATLALTLSLTLDTPI